MAEIVKVEGLEDVRASLLGLPIHLRKKTMYRLLRNAAAPIIKDAKSNAPVAKKATKRVIPGLIKNTIKAGISKFWKPARGDFGIYVKPFAPGKIKSLQSRMRKRGKHVYFGDPYYYKFQEFGFHATGRKRIAGGKSRRIAGRVGLTFVKGKEFLGNAFSRNKSLALNRINADVVMEITKKFNKRGA